MDRICPISGTRFSITDEDLAYLKLLSPKIGGATFALPPPTLCPDERKRRRLAFRNERNLYHRKCDLTGKSIISGYSPDKPDTVYSKSEWWSDHWDYRSYGREFDFSRTFFEQFAELFRAAPKVALVTSPDADENNCPYINFAGNSKNCHMVFDSDFDEDSSYSNVLKHCRNCIDCSYVHTSDLCYECVDCTKCYQLAYSQNCSGCSDSYFLYNCAGCTNCCLSANLVQKQFCFKNEQYTQGEYLKLVEGLGLEHRSNVERTRLAFQSYLAEFPKKFCRLVNSENCVGDYIVQSRNIFSSFNIAEAEDLRYCDSVFTAKNCMDVSSFGEQIDHVYESSTIGINVSNVLFTFLAVLNCSDLLYCIEARHSRNCFGCASVKHAEYCILNRQYTKEDYFKLVPKIIRHMEQTGEWGEFFPMSLSAFGYNETIAQEIFPLDPASTESLGANWSTFAAPLPDVQALSAEQIPESAAEARDEILNGAIRCEESGKPFRLTKPELSFYRTLSLPVPVLHPEVRHLRRMALRNPQKLWASKCAKTGEPILTSFAPESSNIVYGEKAYLEAVHA